MIPPVPIFRDRTLAVLAHIADRQSNGTITAGMTSSLSRISAVALALAAQAAVAADVGPQPIENRFATIHLHSGAKALWDYSLNGVDGRHAVAAPVVNVDGRDVTLSIEAAQ